MLVKGCGLVEWICYWLCIVCDVEVFFDVFVLVLGGVYYFFLMLFFFL